MKLKKFGAPLTGPVFVGIDQSYSGFAITCISGRDYYTTVYKSDVRGIERLKDIREHLRSTLGSAHIVDVAIEGYAFGSQMANMLGELGGMVKLELLDMGKYPLIVPPTSLKKYATGKGQGVAKSQIMLQVYKKWGVEFSDDNAADSYVLARIVAGTHTLEYEKEIFTKLRDPKFRER
jgi:crossover junction endodeoxyribonuclease RuvC